MTRERTGWPPGLLQDDCGKLARWFETRIDARWTLRKVIAERKSMSTKQPEALRLAEYMECSMGCGPIEREAAATLRTQHALLERARDALETHANQYPHMAKGYTVDALAALNQHLDQP